jgi:hypothetical protein
MEESKSGVESAPSSVARRGGSGAMSCVGKRDMVTLEDIEADDLAMLVVKTPGRAAPVVSCRSLKSIRAELKAQGPGTANWIPATYDEGTTRYYKLAMPWTLWVDKRSNHKLRDRALKGPVKFNIQPKRGPGGAPFHTTINTTVDMAPPGPVVYVVSRVVKRHPRDVPETMAVMLAIRRANHYELVRHGCRADSRLPVSEALPVPDWRHVPLQVAASGGSVTLMKRLVSGVVFAVGAARDGTMTGAAREEAAIVQINRTTGAVDVTATPVGSRERLTLDHSVNVRSELSTSVPGFQATSDQDGFELELTRVVARSVWKDTLAKALPSVLLGATGAGVYLVLIDNSNGTTVSHQELHMFKTLGSLFQVPALIAEVRASPENWYT